jgi:(p)ppGpp synthase/HD superfamily hydrolase
METMTHSGVALSKKSLEILNSPELKSIESFAIKAHHDTNHFYDEYLPYEFHLRMVNKAAKDFIYLIPVDKIYTVIAGCWCHDTVEDARQNYNSIKKISNKDVAEIVRAVTNYGRGRDRNERMPDFVYEDIKNTPFATFVKLCDRIANVQYSKMTGSDMFLKYKKEHEHFKAMLYVVGENEPVWEYLSDIFNDEK